MSVQKNTLRCRLFIRMYYLNIVTWKISLYVCICASTIVKSLQQLEKKKARNIKWQCLDMDLSLMFQLFYHDQKY